MFSVYDTQNCDWLWTGRNSKTKNEALEEAFYCWVKDCFTKEEAAGFYKDREAWLKSVGVVVREHEERLPDHYGG
jgi:hypothetical protein